MSEPELIVGPLVGGLSPSGVRLWGRSSGPGRLHAWIGEEPDLSDASLQGISLPLTPEFGFAGVVLVGGLSPGTRYYYYLTLSDTPPPSLPDRYPTFQTAPHNGARVPFNMAFGSCFLPTDRMGGQIFQAISNRREVDNLRFMMLLGDQIYAEAANRNGLGKVAVSLDEYRAVYEYNWTRPALQALLSNLPAFMIMDDHEVDNDWYWADIDRTQARIPWFDRLLRLLYGRPLEERSLSPHRVNNALQAYWENQAMHAPVEANRTDAWFVGQDAETFDKEEPAAEDLVDEIETSATADEEDPEAVANAPRPNQWGPFYYDFVFGGAAYFVFDLRTQRVKAGRRSQLLGEEQWKAFETWLLTVKDEYPVKFLVTPSSILFDMWVDITSDRWNGFPDERDRLFATLSDMRVEEVYILTGDLHSSHAIQASIRTVEGEPLPIWEFCASPFEQSHSLLAKYTYRPVRSDWLADQILDFRAAEYSFGVVEVDFPVDTPPEVVFKVYGQDGEKLAQAGG